jgi:hypothetical protein
MPVTTAQFRSERETAFGEMTIRSVRLSKASKSTVGSPRKRLLTRVGAPLSEMPVFRPRYCFRGEPRALLTNGDYALKWFRGRVLREKRQVLSI